MLIRLYAAIQITVISTIVVICWLMPCTVLAEGSGFPAGDDTVESADCMECHNDQQIVGAEHQINQTYYLNTAHAQFGCRTCHNNGHGEPIDKAKCNECHSDVAEQYALSNHSKVTPDCSSCHNPHKVQKAEKTFALEMNETCIDCHNQINITATHAQWLPQTGLHLEAIACVTCHTKASEYALSVYIARKAIKNSTSRPLVVSYNYLRNKVDSNEIHQLVDTNHDNYISLEELRKFNSNKQLNKELYLKAILTPVTMTHDFQISDKSYNCTFCHASGPNSAQISRLVLPEEDGSYRQMAIENGATLGSLGTIPDFYMMGSTRNSLLNIFGAVILAGGLIMPVGHGFMRFLTRKNRKESNDHE